MLGCPEEKWPQRCRCNSRLHLLWLVMLRSQTSPNYNTILQLKVDIPTRSRCSSNANEDKKGWIPDETSLILDSDEPTRKKSSNEYVYSDISSHTTIYLSHVLKFLFGRNNHHKHMIKARKALLFLPKQPRNSSKKWRIRCASHHGTKYGRSKPANAAAHGASIALIK